MNSQIFIDTRKRLHLSQAQLAEGICTQATLSKFEKNGKVPSIKILLKLCDRLGLTLNDLFPLDRQDDTQRTKALDQAEFQLIQSEYEQARAGLAALGAPDQDSATFQMQYYFVRGYVTALNQGRIEDALYDFSRILNELDERHTTIFSLLAYTGMGIAYNQVGDAAKAEFYFDKVFGQIYQLPIENTHTVWRYINIVYYTAAFFGQTGELKASNDLLAYALRICSQQHVTYYVARILYQRAQNRVTAGIDDPLVWQDLNDAQAFARINNNQKLLATIETFQQQLTTE